MKRERSKQYFRNVRAEETWADIEKESLSAIRTRAYMMKIMKPRGKVCLSLACGWGRFLRDYLEKGGKIVVGADINEENLVKCKNVGVELVLCDIENLPFRNNIIDAMECVATMEHLVYPGKIVKEMRRIINEARGTAFISWVYYNWLKALYDRKSAVRLFWRVRDLICDLVPAIIRNVLLRGKFPGFKNYGIDRNSGFSFPTIMQIYEKACMRIILAEYLSDEDIIIVCSRARKGACMHDRTIYELEKMPCKE